MKLSEYEIREEEVVKKHELDLHNLRMEYVVRNRICDIGYYVHNVTGIIKVTRIGYGIAFGVPYLKYYGYRYRKVKGELIRTKDNKISHLNEMSTRKMNFDHDK